jgi:hypothetical protein
MDSMREKIIDCVEKPTRQYRETLTQDEEGGRKLWPVLRQQHEGVLRRSRPVLLIVKGANQELCLLLVLRSTEEALWSSQSRPHSVALAVLRVQTPFPLPLLPEDGTRSLACFLVALSWQALCGCQNWGAVIMHAAVIFKRQAAIS